MDTKNTEHNLLFTYIGMIMYHKISFDVAIDALADRIMGADYENDPAITEALAKKALVYLETFF